MPLASGVGQYSRTKLSPEQEVKFCSEVDAWIDNGWLVPYGAARHGPPGAVLPLLAVCQEHKAMTPVRPCLDYRLLNSCIVSNQGKDAPVSAEKIRKWRQRHGQSKVIDIRKAYLNVRVHPELQRFLMMVWEGRQYVIERMGFGLAVAPKLMDAIVRWVVRSFPETDRGVWAVPSTDCWKLWCDASGIAYGVVLQGGKDVLEDQCWLRPGEDKRHINVAELDAVIKGLNLACSWGLEKLTVVTDSQTIFGWLRSLLGDVKRVKASGVYQVLVQRRLQMIDDIVSTAQTSLSNGSRRRTTWQTSLPVCPISSCSAGRLHCLLHLMLRTSTKLWLPLQTLSL